MILRSRGFDGLPPPRTPPSVIRRVNREIVGIVARTDVREKFSNAGVEAVGNSPGELADTVKSGLNVLGELNKDLKIQAESH
jgi:tripartite-type tricarboxylate transporter receptor subunit TctC